MLLVEKVIEDNIVFVSGDITNPDCFLAIKKNMAL